MAKKLNAAAELKPWSRRPWPKRGNRSQARLYEAVGRALSEWERYDAVLSFMFSAFVTTKDFLAARRAYGSVRTFEGRCEMLRAAAEAYFIDHPDEALAARFKQIMTNSKNYSERRNDITHAAVDHFRPEPPKKQKMPAPNTYALFPSFATFRNRDPDGTPTYCYTADELEYFRQEFFKLRRPAADLSAEISTAWIKQASAGKLRKLYRN